MKQREALFTAILLILAAPKVTLAQSVFDSVPSPDSLSFSTNNLPLQSNYPPLDSAVNLGTNIVDSNSGSPDTSNFSTSGLFEVDDIYQQSKDFKPSFLKDLLSGPSGQRALHPTTVKVFNVLGKAQKGLQTYKLGRSVLDAVKGKNPGGIVGGVQSILALYGVIDPNAALATAATIGTSQRIGSIVDANKNAKEIKTATVEKPETPYQWYNKSRNNDAIASMAAQTGPDIVLGEAGQQQIEADEVFAAASVEAMDAVIQDAAASAIEIRTIEQSSRQQAASTVEINKDAQQAKSTQKAVKTLNSMAQIQANLSSAQVSAMATLNDSSLRQLGGIASMVGLQKVQGQKTTTLQFMTALNGRQLGNINSGIHRTHNYQVQKDLKALKRRSRSLGNLITPQPVVVDNPTTTTTTAAAASQGQRVAQ